MNKHINIANGEILTPRQILNENKRGINMKWVPIATLHNTTLWNWGFYE